MKKRFLFLLIILFTAGCAKQHIIRDKEQPALRVALKHKVLSAVFSCDNAYSLKTPSGSMKLSSSDTVKITYNNRMLQVHITGKGKLKEPRFPVSVISNKGICSVDGKPYRGMLYVIGDADGYLLVLNKVLMEDYLLGVVPAEIGRVGKELLEAAKAQAVAARTYAISHIGKHYDMGYDVECTVSDQVYGGVLYEYPVTNDAVKQTRGIVALYNNIPIDAKYHSTCGGYTCNNEDEWGGSPAPYLRGIKDSYGCLFFPKYYCSDSKHFYWEHVFDKAYFYKFISANAGTLKGKTINVKTVKITDRSHEGRINEITLYSDRNEAYTFKGLDIRRLFNGVDAPGNMLRSRFFNIDININTVVIKGNGFGHGVGMCQYGAMGMAKKGKGFTTILKHYYRGISLEKLY